MNLDQVVPKEIRLQVYLDAIEHIKENRQAHGLISHSLCLLLPCILWDLENYLYSKAPDGENWSYHEVVTAFPEVDKWCLLDHKKLKDLTQLRSERIIVLENAVKILRNEK